MLRASAPLAGEIRSGDPLGSCSPAKVRANIVSGAGSRAPIFETLELAHDLLNARSFVISSALLQWRSCMIDLLKKLCARFNDLVTFDTGQDLVEYSLLILILALGTIASVPPL